MSILLNTPTQLFDESEGGEHDLQGPHGLGGGGCSSEWTEPSEAESTSIRRS